MIFAIVLVVTASVQHPILDSSYTVGFMAIPRACLVHVSSDGIEGWNCVSSSPRALRRPYATCSSSVSNCSSCFLCLLYHDQPRSAFVCCSRGVLKMCTDFGSLQGSVFYVSTLPRWFGLAALAGPAGDALAEVAAL